MRLLTTLGLLTLSMIGFMYAATYPRTRIIKPSPTFHPVPWPLPTPPALVEAPEPEPQPQPEPPLQAPLTPMDLPDRISFHVDHLEGLGNRWGEGGLQANWAGVDGMGLEIGWLSHEGLSLGLRKSFLFTDSLQGYVSGGLFLDEEELTTTTTTTTAGKGHGKCKKSQATSSTVVSTDTDRMLSPYGQVGINYLIDQHYTFGLGYRHSFVSDMSTVDQDALMFTIGYSF